MHAGWHKSAIAVVDQAGAAVPRVEGLIEVLGAADAERYPLQRSRMPADSQAKRAAAEGQMAWSQQYPARGEPTI